MRILKFKKKSLIPFLKAISRESELWAPVKKGNKYVFDVAKDLTQVQPSCTRTIIPPKKIFLPTRFSMFTISDKGYQADFSHTNKKILFGIHPCDIHGLLIMDRFYSFVYNDPYYSRARANTIILGHSCWPDEYCMCRSTNTHIVEEGYDLFFTDLEKYYLVWTGSSLGDDLIKAKPELFEETITDSDIQTFIQWREERDKAYTAEMNFIAMPDLMELKYKDPIWEKLGNACLACGSCTMVCPTCNCYNVLDRPNLDMKSAQILRCWDACTLENYSEVAGGENFREKRSDRLKLWFTHKLQAYISKYGKPACVGCGRCVVTCPVDINVKTVACALEGEKPDAFWSRLNKEQKDERSL